MPPLVVPVFVMAEVERQRLYWKGSTDLLYLSLARDSWLY